MNDLANAFDLAMLSIHHRAKTAARYRASAFLGMLNARGGLQTARQLINSTKPSEGYTRLWELGRLDLTVEATVIDNARWHSLFRADELEKARKRLRDYGYELSTMKAAGTDLP